MEIKNDLQPVNSVAQYIGYNTIGSNSETPTAGLTYLKKVTLPVGGLLLGIDLHIKGTNTTSAVGAMVGVWADNAGVPLTLLTQQASNNQGNIILDDTYRWLTIPVGLYLTSGTYWLGFVKLNNLVIHYDTGGSDVSYTGGTTALYDADRFTQSNSTRSYSLRGTFLPC